MAEVVKKLPPGLREDSRLWDGVYVGPRNTDVSILCARKEWEPEHVIGSCDDPEPESVWVDDQKGDIYIPMAGGNYMRFGGRDGIKNHYIRVERWVRWDQTVEWIEGMAGIRYFWRGVSSLAPGQIKILLDSNPDFHDELYAHVLDQRQSKFKNREGLLLDAALHWLVEREEESLYRGLAQKTLEEIAQNPVAEPSLRHLAEGFLGWIDDGYRPEEPKGEVFLALLNFIRESEHKTKYRFAAAISAHRLAQTDETRRIVTAAMLSLVEDSKADPLYRCLAGKFAFEKMAESQESAEKALEALLNFVGDSRADSRFRDNAADFVFSKIMRSQEFFTLRDKAVNTFCRFVRDSRTEFYQRYYMGRQAYALAETPERKEKALAALLYFARDKRSDLTFSGEESSAKAAERRKAAKFVFGEAADSKSRLRAVEVLIENQNWKSVIGLIEQGSFSKEEKIELAEAVRNRLIHPDDRAEVFGYMQAVREGKEQPWLAQRKIFAEPEQAAQPEPVPAEKPAAPTAKDEGVRVVQFHQD